MSSNSYKLTFKSLDRNQGCSIAAWRLLFTSTFESNIINHIPQNQPFNLVIFQVMHANPNDQMCPSISCVSLKKQQSYKKTKSTRSNEWSTYVQSS